MKRLLFAILVGLMLWTVGRWGLQAQGLHRAARELAAALEQDPVCVAVFGWEPEAPVWV